MENETATSISAGAILKGANPLRITSDTNLATEAHTGSDQPSFEGSGAPVTKLYVGSIPYDWNAEQLEALFKPYGSVTSAAIVSDQITRRPKGFGFVEFESEASARKAMSELNGREIEGRSLSVREARPHVERSYNNDRPQRERYVISIDNTEMTDTTGRSYGNRRGWW
ncbi:MAG TPA: RNA-binding protein [Candidatus Kapabacteria bacterium]|jgi:RNA recognition motif-containing protein|nr:RNA-binding protein [Candidatus Kapabacteria bacterium]